MTQQPIHNREPILTPVPIAGLRPTQITVGMREVTEKRRQWRERVDRDGGEFLGRHMIPVLLGPKRRHYVIDHHHLARALEEEGIKNILVTIVADLHALQKSSFWVVLDHRGWCHPYDASGRRRDFDDPILSTIPTAASQVNCGWQAASPRTRRRSVNSSGRISSAAVSARSRSGPISRPRSQRHSSSPRQKTPNTCRVGAVPRREQPDLGMLVDDQEGRKRTLDGDLNCGWPGQAATPRVPATSGSGREHRDEASASERRTEHRSHWQGP